MSEVTARYLAVISEMTISAQKHIISDQKHIISEHRHIISEQKHIISEQSFPKKIIERRRGFGGHREISRGHLGTGHRYLAVTFEATPGPPIRMISFPNRSIS